MSPPADTERPPLTRPRALRAAVALADDAGLDAVSMRNLAERLDVVPMALYKHVANKEDLLDGMVDTIVADPDPAGAGGAPAGGDPADADADAVSAGGGPDPHWKATVRRRVLAMRAVLLAHPWARAVIETRTRRTPAVLAHMDALAGSFMAGGLSADLSHHAMHLLGHRIWGFSPEAFTEAEPPSLPDDPADRAAMVRQWTETYPHIAAIATHAAGGDLSTGTPSCDEQFEFAFALDVLLDAIDHLHQAGWSSTDAHRGVAGS